MLQCMAKGKEDSTIDGIKVANQLTLKRENNLNYPDGLNVITRVLKSESGDLKNIMLK